MDDDIRPWLKSFVESVGQEKAKALLAGAGNFVHLGSSGRIKIGGSITKKNFGNGEVFFSPPARFLRQGEKT